MEQVITTLHKPTQQLGKEVTLPNSFYEVTTILTHTHTHSQRRGTQLAQSAEWATLDLRVLDSSPMLSVEII